MTTVNELALGVDDRIEEARGAPIFWNQSAEIYVFINEALNEAALITGEPEVRQSTPLTLTPNTTVFPAPPGVIAIMRIQAPNWLGKTTVWDLDRFQPGWESDVGDVPSDWFPIGMTQFGIHPQVSQPVIAYLTYVALPIATGRPFTGNENVPFQAEFLEGFIDYASHVAGLKEGGEEFIQSAKLYDRFLTKMTELSNFGYRKNSLRFTRTIGPAAVLTRVEKQ